MPRLPVFIAALALLALPAPAAARVIAIASGDVGLTLADVSTNKVINRVPIGGQTSAVAMAPDGKLAYVASGARVAVVDLAKQAVVGGLNVGGGVQGLAISADGARVYAARQAGVDIVDTHALQVIGTVKLATKAPAGRIAVSIDGTRAVVVLDDKHVEVLDLTRFAPLKRLEIEGPADVAFGPALTAYVATTTGKLALVGTPTGRVLRAIKVGKGVGGGVAVSEGGTRAYVGALKRSRVFATLDLTNGTPLARSAARLGPGPPALSPDGLRAYVANQGEPTVTVVSARTGKRISTIRLPGSARPRDLAVQPGFAPLNGTGGDDDLRGTRLADRIQ